MAPRAFLHFTKLVSVLVLVGIIASFALVFALNMENFFIGHCIVGVCVAIGLFITAMEFLMYKRFMDGMYKKVTGHNLVATRKPRGEVKKGSLSAVILTPLMSGAPYIILKIRACCFGWALPSEAQ